MSSPSSIRGTGRKADSTKSDSQTIKNNLIHAITKLRSDWNSDSANVFYDECEEMNQGIDDSTGKIVKIKDEINTMAGEVQRAEAERAAKRAAERRAAEAAILALKNKPMGVKTNL